MVGFPARGLMWSLGVLALGVVEAAQPGEAIGHVVVALVEHENGPLLGPGNAGHKQAAVARRRNPLANIEDFRRFGGFLCLDFGHAHHRGIEIGIDAVAARHDA